MIKKNRTCIFSAICGLSIFMAVIGTYLFTDDETFSKEINYKTILDMPTPKGILGKPDNIEKQGELDFESVGINSSDILTSNGISEVYIGFQEIEKGLIYLKITNVNESKMRIVISEIDDVDITPAEVRTYSEGFYPLTFESEKYVIRILSENSIGLLSQVFSKTFEADFDKNEPYKYANVYSTYDEDSELAKKAYELTYNLKTNGAKALCIKKFIDKNFEYDYEKEKLILENSYNNSFVGNSSDEKINEIVSDLVDTDFAYSQNKGVCFHFSSLFSSMMKSVGVTTREVRGYSLSTGDKYHTWNEYLDEGGNWVPIEVGTKVLNNKVYRDEYSER